jgi:hypothetical protein
LQYHFHDSIMRQARKRLRLVWQRAFLVVGALLCLCVSDSAGPRLVPLPALPVVHSFETLPVNRDHSFTRTPSPPKGPNAYIEMLVGGQYRARDRHQNTPTATHTPAASLQLKPGILKSTPNTYTPVDFETASFSVPTGRAPPRFV